MKSSHCLKDLDEVGLYLPQTKKSKEGDAGKLPEEGWAEVRCIAIFSNYTETVQCFKS